MSENERLIKKIMDETGDRRGLAETSLIQLGKLHPALNEVVEAWKKGKELPFEFNGITMADILKKEKGSYFSAIFTMSTLLKNPDWTKDYLTLEFFVDDISG